MSTLTCSVCGAPARYVADGAFCALDMLTHLKGKLHDEMLRVARQAPNRRIGHQAALVHTAIIGNYFAQAEQYLMELEALTRGTLVFNVTDCLEWIRQAAKVWMEINATKQTEVHHG